MGRKSVYSVGQVFGKLEIVDIILPNLSGKHVKLNCLCHYCGQTKIMNGVSLKKRNSCGCQQRKSSEWKSVGPKTKPWQLPYGVAARNNLESRYKNASRRKRREYSLTSSEFNKLVIGKCVYCGSQQESTIKGQGKTSGDYKYTGIDRIDSSRGYIKENCVSCCWKCNNMKGTNTVEDFLSHINKIVEFKK